MKIPKEVIKARKKYKSIRIICPHLDDFLRPSPMLINEKCPCGKDVRCAKCEKFIGFWAENGEINSYTVYEGFCDCKEFLATD